MADNYLGNKMEEHFSSSHSKGAPSKLRPSLRQLLQANRSYRGYDNQYIVSKEQLKQMVEVNTLIPSAMNQQILRFRLVDTEEADKVLKHIRLGGALPDLHLPLPGTEPRAFIIVCSTLNESKYVDIDLGISAQSMLLKAAEMKLNGICIGAFNKEEIAQEFNLKYSPILVIAIGKGIEKIALKPINAEEDHRYYRVDGVHYVPKVKLEDLMI